MAGGYLAAMERRGLSPYTILNYRGHLERLCTFLDHRPPTLKLLRDWVDEIRRAGRAMSYVAACTNVCRMFFRWTAREGLIESSPAEALETPKLGKRLPKSLQPHVVAGLLEAAAAGAMPERDRALVLFLVETGVRRTAAAKLTADKLDMANGWAQVIEKGNIERVVNFSGKTREALRAWLTVRGLVPIRSVSRDYLFGLSSWGIYTRLCALSSQAKLPHITPHMLRHTCATLRSMQGIDAPSLKSVMGWADIRMAEWYIQFVPDQVRQRALETSPLKLIRTE
jgi:site-specific recombinase XerD